MMLDAVWTVLLVACWPVAVVLIVSGLPERRHRGIAVAGLLAIWFAMTAATRVPGIAALPDGALGILLPVLIGSAMLAATRAGRTIVAELSLAPLIALHVARFAGGGFLLLHEAGRLSNPFAAYAGWGDILAAGLAIPTAVFAARRLRGWLPLTLIWNIVGFADFCSAIFFATTSQPGSPLRLFLEPPGTAVIMDLPWRFIPGFYVPVLLLIHVAIFLHLRHVVRSRRSAESSQ